MCLKIEVLAKKSKYWKMNQKLSIWTRQKQRCSRGNQRWNSAVSAPNLSSENLRFQRCLEIFRWWTALKETWKCSESELISAECLWHVNPGTLYVAGLSIYNDKSVIVKSWNIARGKKSRYRYVSSGLWLIICWRETLSILDIFSATANFWTATEDIGPPKTMSSVTWSRENLKFSSSLSGSPTSSG